MKKLYTITALVIIISLCTALVSCSGDPYKVDGVEVSEYAIVHVVNSDYNFMVKVNNTTSEDIEFDMSRFALKLNDEEDIPHMAGRENCPANKKIGYTFMIDPDHPDFEIGDSVSVYYDDKKLAEIKVGELE